MSTPELFHTWNNFVANITLGMLWADRMCALATIFTLGESVKFIRFGLGSTVFFKLSMLQPKSHMAFNFDPVVGNS